MKGTVGELGEFGLIRELTSRLTTTPAVRIGPGDDAVVQHHARLSHTVILKRHKAHKHRPISGIVIV